MADTAPLKKGTPVPPLRDRPKRERKDLTERELEQVGVHVRRNASRSTSWLSDLIWVTEELVDQIRGAS